MIGIQNGQVSLETNIQQNVDSIKWEQVKDNDTYWDDK